METIQFYKILAISVFIIYSVIIFFIYERDKNKIKKEQLRYIDKRIAVLEKENDDAIASYGTDNRVRERLLINGSGVKAYKDIRNYIDTH